MAHQYLNSPTHSSEHAMILIDDLWPLIAESLTLLDLRSLALVCKYLYRTFTADEWFFNHKRFIFMKDRNNHDDFIPSFTQTALSRRITGCDIHVCELLIDGQRCIHGSTRDLCDLPPALTVISNFSEAKALYLQLQRQDLVKIIFDVPESELIYSCYIRLIRRNVAAIWSNIYLFSFRIKKESYSYKIEFVKELTKEKIDRLCELVIYDSEQLRIFGKRFTIYYDLQTEGEAIIAHFKKK